MDTDIRAVGCAGAPFTVTLVPGSATPDLTFSCERTFWFDRDVDGSWLVWATGPDVLGGEPVEVGSIHVRDVDVTDFLDVLSHLLAFPGQFAHGPRLDEVAGLTSRPAQRVHPDEPDKA